MKSFNQTAKTWFPGRQYSFKTIEPVPVHPDVNLEDEYHYELKTFDGTIYSWYWDVRRIPDRRIVQRTKPDGTITEWVLPIQMWVTLKFYPKLGTYYRIYGDGSFDIRIDDEMIYVGPAIDVEPIVVKSVFRYNMFYDPEDWKV